VPECSLDAIAAAGREIRWTESASGGARRARPRCGPRLDTGALRSGRLHERRVEYVSAETRARIWGGSGSAARARRARGLRPSGRQPRGADMAPACAPAPSGDHLEAQAAEILHQPERRVLAIARPIGSGSPARFPRRTQSRGVELVERRVRETRFESAGISRHGEGDVNAPHRRISDPRWPRVMRWRSVRAQRSVDRGRVGGAVEPRNFLIRGADALNLSGRPCRWRRYARAVGGPCAVGGPRHARQAPCARTGRSRG
jgi:hypothetical protein